MEKRRLDKGAESPSKRARTEKDEGDLAPIIVNAPPAALGALQKRATSLRLGRNPGIPDYTIAVLLQRWIASLPENMFVRLKKSLDNHDIVDHRILTTDIVADFMPFATRDLCAFLLENELCYGLDTNDWLKTNDQFQDRAHFSSLLSRIMNRYVRSINEPIGQEILNDYQAWYALAASIVSENGVDDDFSIIIPNGIPGNNSGDSRVSRELFAHHPNIPRFAFKMFVLPQCQWPLIITPFYAGFLVHLEQDGRNVVMLYAFELPYPITCLPEYVNFEVSTLRQGYVTLLITFDEPVPWRDGELKRTECIEYVDMGLDLLGMEQYVKSRMELDTIQLIPTQGRDDKKANSRENSQASSSASIQDIPDYMVVPIPRATGRFITTKPNSIARVLNHKTQVHGVSITEQNGQLCYTLTNVEYSTKLDSGKQLVYYRTTWGGLLETAARDIINKFQRNIGNHIGLKLPDEATNFSLDPIVCQDLARFLYAEVKRGRCILTKVEVTGDRGEFFVAALQYSYDKDIMADFNKSLVPFLAASNNAPDKMRQYLRNHVTIGIAFGRNLTQSNTKDFWNVVPLFMGVGREQTICPAFQVNNCIVGYCYEGQNVENIPQAQILQLSWSYIHRALGVQNHQFPEIDENTMAPHNYATLFTLPVEDVNNANRRMDRHYTCQLMQWQMSRGMVIIYANHRADGNNQLDTHPWCTATLAHYNGNHWMTNIIKDDNRTKQYYTVNLKAGHIRSYDQVLYDKGVFYIGTAQTLEPSSSFSQDYLYEDLSDDERKKKQHFTLQVLRFKATVLSGEDAIQGFMMVDM